MEGALGIAGVATRISRGGLKCYNRPPEQREWGHAVESRSAERGGVRFPGAAGRLGQVCPSELHEPAVVAAAGHMS